MNRAPMRSKAFCGMFFAECFLLASSTRHCYSITVCEWGVRRFHPAMTGNESLKLDARRKARALCLLSGGLDSRLAVCLLREQGVEIQGLAFDSPFFHPETAVRAADALGIPLRVVDFTGEIVALLHDPPHGFGKCMNPCLDCHALMVRRAGELLGECGANFIATGEVLNQRPMSQNRRGLDVVADDSGFGEVLLRPLSAKRLEPTRPEREGLVDRARLLGIEGRGRKVQMEMARRYGLNGYPTPAGGCRLTEPNFCRRLKDLLDHHGVLGVRDITMLRYGRHFRLDDRVKAIVGRNEQDNAYLEGNAGLYDLVLNLEGIPGPVGLLPNTASEEQLLRVAAMCARYSGAGEGTDVTFRVRSARGIRRIRAQPSSGEELRTLMI